MGRCSPWEEMYSIRKGSNRVAGRTDTALKDNIPLEMNSTEAVAAAGTQVGRMKERRIVEARLMFVLEPGPWVEAEVWRIERQRCQIAEGRRWIARPGHLENGPC